MKDVFGHSSNQTEVNPNAAPITQINPKAAALNVPQTTVNLNAVGSPGNSTQVNSNALPFVQPTQGNHELYVGQSKTIRLPHQIFHAILTLPCPT